jgi:hypothetical protein
MCVCIYAYADVLRQNAAVILTLGHLAIDIPAGAEKHQVF